MVTMEQLKQELSALYRLCRKYFSRSAVRSEFAAFTPTAMGQKEKLAFIRWNLGTTLIDLGSVNRLVRMLCKREALRSLLSSINCPFTYDFRAEAEAQQRFLKQPGRGVIAVKTELHRFKS